MIQSFQMPVLRPVLIPTNQEGFSVWQKVKVWLSQSRTFELVDDWYFAWDFTLQGQGEVDVLIPKGFVFDGASIPRFLWWALNPYGILMIPGLIHDYFYKYGHLKVLRSRDDIRSIVPVIIFGGEDQKFVDKLFRDVAIEINGMRILTTIAYLALRCCGFVAWNKHREKEHLK